MPGIVEGVILGCTIGLWGFVWTQILTDPDHLFAFVGRLVMRLPMWIQKPLTVCPVCHAGQVAFWVCVEKAYMAKLGWDGCFCLLVLAIFISYQTMKRI